jgi:hypothetical protein
MKRKIVVASVAVVAVVGAGAGIAATKLGSPQETSKAVIDDAAGQLGISPAKLSDALKKAYENQIDAAVAAGTITKERGDTLKARIESSDYPPIGFGLGGRLGGPVLHGFGFMDAAAKYLGLTQVELRTQIAGGKTLADVAKAQGKSVDGLVSALVAAEKTALDAAVKAGRLTQAQADQVHANATQRFTDMVNGTFPGPLGRGDGLRHGRHRGPGNGAYGLLPGMPFRTA